MPSIAVAIRIAWGFAGALIAYSVGRYWLGLIFDLLLLAVVALIGVVAFGISLLVIFRHPSRRAYIALSVVLVTWGIWLLTPTYLVSAYARAFVESPKYSAAVRELQEGKIPLCVAEKSCDLDDGPPRRLAFSYGGIIDNWVGVVYDPLDIADQEHSGLRFIFGGDLVGCNHLWGHYYICSFT
jgi:hypothetical protein